jgi:dTDP-4-dehydrorhamnose 3,5-epimerase
MKCTVKGFSIAGLKLITPNKFDDNRGFFSETYNAQILAELGIHENFVQDNHSLSMEKGTVRGLHFQHPPHAQAKLLRVSRGSILDVAVDIRRGSPTYGQHVALELSAENWQQLYVPAGFAHGFCTTAPDTELQYKVSDYYAPKHDAGILWNDPALGIAWPDFAGAQLSPKDILLPRFSDLVTPFVDA